MKMIEQRCRLEGKQTLLDIFILLLPALKRLKISGHRGTEYRRCAEPSRFFVFYVDRRLLSEDFKNLLLDFKRAM